ncbi:MAG: ABC transporter permease subunit [Thermodesulfobacteriota bacterium]
MPADPVLNNVLFQPMPPPRLLFRDHTIVRTLSWFSLCLLGLFVLFPTIEIIRTSFMGTGGISLVHYTSYFLDLRTVQALWNSLFVSTLSTGITLIFAFAYAYVLARMTIPCKNFFLLVILLPLISPSLVQALAFIFLFGRNGLITSHLLGLNVNIYGWPGIVISEVFYCLPQAVLLIYSSLLAIDASLYEAAESLGASSFRIFRKITLPGIKYGLASATFMVFNLVITDFGNPVVIGGDYPVLATEIYVQVFGLQNFGLASAVSVILLIPATGAFAMDYFFGRRSVAMISGQARPFTKESGRKAKVYGLVYLFSVAGFILLIYATIAVASVVKIWGYNFTPTLEHYFFKMLGGYGVFWTSLYSSAIAAIATALLSFAIAYLLERQHPPFRNLLNLMVVIPAAIPGIVSGLSYIFAFNKQPLLLTGTVTIIILNHISRFITFGVLSCRANIKQIDISMEEASTSLGCGILYTLRRILFPLSKPSIVSTTVYVFIRAMVTLSSVIFLISPGINLAPTSVVYLVNDGKLNSASAMCTLILLIIVAILVVAKLLFKEAIDITGTQGLQS